MLNNFIHIHIYFICFLKINNTYSVKSFVNLFNERTYSNILYNSIDQYYITIIIQKIIQQKKVLKYTFIIFTMGDNYCTYNKAK